MFLLPSTEGRMLATSVIVFYPLRTRPRAFVIAPQQTTTPETRANTIAPSKAPLLSSLSLTTVLCSFSLSVLMKILRVQRQISIKTLCSRITMFRQSEERRKGEEEEIERDSVAHMREEA
jgi:hypothetical protein